MIETVLGGLFGGILRLAPEAIKLWDRKDERKHELNMLDRELDFAKVKAEAGVRAAESEVATTQLDTMAEAIKEQAQTAQLGGKFVAAISALVRPIVTYIFIILYTLVKLSVFILAVAQSGSWATVLVGLWGADDMAVLNMILGFWFVGRVYERRNS